MPFAPLPPKLRALGQVLIFALAAGGGCALLGWAFPMYLEVEPLPQKLQTLAARAQECDTLFLGSSHVYQQIDPALFDRVTAEGGQPTHSFNFGVLGLYALEDSYVCEQIFRSPLPRLRWVFVEVGTFWPGIWPREEDSPRAVYWHQARSAWAACRFYFPPPAKPLKQRAGWRLRGAAWAHRAAAWYGSAEEIRPHLRRFALRAMNLGRGTQPLHRLLDPEHSALSPLERVLGAAGDGFVPTPAPTEAVADQAKFVAYLADHQRLPTREFPLPAVAQENLEFIQRLVHRSGAQLCLLLTPTLYPFRILPAREMGVPMVDFSDDRRGSELSRADVWVDFSHLNATGAEIYTRQLAARWLASGDREPSR